MRTHLFDFMSVIITTSWDDGNRFDFRVSEMLEKFSLKGTFYIPVQYSHRDLDDKDVLKLSKKFEIGSHGLTHTRLTSLGMGEKMKELVDSKKNLEKIVHKKIKCFAYPYGAYDTESLECVRSAGYTFARTSKEFHLGKQKNTLVSHISLELSNKISRLLSPRGFWYVITCGSWTRIAKRLFDKTPDNGVFHVFGHSWEIAKNNEWKKLEQLFKYITSRKEFISLNNSELVIEKMMN